MVTTKTMPKEYIQKKMRKKSSMSLQKSQWNTKDNSNIRREVQKRYKIDKKHMNKMIIASPFLSIITVNVNVLNFFFYEKT